MVGQILAELLCNAIFYGAFAAASGDSQSSRTTTLDLKTPQQRRAQQTRTCAVDGCYALSFRTTDFCWRHQDQPPSDPEPEPEPVAEGNWWEE